MLNLRSLLTLAVLAPATSLAACGGNGDDTRSAGDTTTPAAAAPATAGVKPDLAACLRRANVVPTSSARDLKFAGTGLLSTGVSGTTSAGESTASLYDDEKNFTVYVIAKKGQEISQTEVRESPASYEFVGFLRSADGPSVDAADRCLDGDAG